MNDYSTMKAILKTTEGDYDISGGEELRVGDIVHIDGKDLCLIARHVIVEAEDAYRCDSSNGVISMVPDGKEYVIRRVEFGTTIV